MEKVNIIIADDHTLVRSGLREIIKHFDFINHIYEAADGFDVIKLLKDLKKEPELLLLDIQMPNMNGVETIKHIREANYNIKIVILTMLNQESLMKDLLKEDINGFLLKDVITEELESTLKRVIDIGFCFDDKLVQLMRHSMIGKSYIETKNSSVLLSEREKQVLELICKEKTAKEIATELEISHRTVEVHKLSLISKTYAKNNVGLVLYAIRNDLFKV